ncbi:MAG TPA: Gfo/Idh/MocA family oxidoreductase [Chloroflexota bacterium]|jgi:predicted dehydrogenase|nr:Gfo/Idh/MocA family oxidoreductase [Chloroflexota bacterium]
MNQTAPAKVGIIGCGQISATYLKNAKDFRAFDVVAVADTRLEAAQARAAEFGVPKALGVEELLGDPEVELVINLTPHRVHGEVGLQVLTAGKHLYNEKPLAIYREEARRLLEEAARRGLRVGAAPDTFFGGAWQTARKLIDEGAIGEPVAAFISLHARPPGRRAPQEGEYVSFYLTDFFEYGGGWAFDRGPYYLHAVLNLLGPVRRVTGSARKTWEERERGGKLLPVRAPSHVAGILDFAAGPVCQFLMTADVYSTGLPHVEVYGSEGSLRCIDPNNFGGQLYLRRPESPELIPVETQFGYNTNSRGVGVADMVAAIRSGRPHRASGELGYHVVDIVNAIHEASAENRHVVLESTCERPAPLPVGRADWTIDP